MPGVIFLCDTSSSMADMSGYRRRIDVLRDVLHELLPDDPDAPLLFEFNSICRQVHDPRRLDEPSGGTAMAAALAYVRMFHPERLFVISDGKPTDGEELALRNARALECQIETYFVGRDDDFAASAFMRALAWCSLDGLGHARVIGLDHAERLTAELRLRLTFDAAAPG